jgi:DNA mismatch repair protein MutS2
MAPSEIDVRGLTVEGAEAEVVAALDRAVMVDLPLLRVIHGKGTGALRSAVAALLRRDPRVARYRLAPAEQGGSGVTLVELGP